ncbi:MAG TPA: glycoside hydrolase family 15 protein [Acidimicrobiia bacterium]|nr:glycoside hydrolase family 15 protein [Acidimicrobiia bacterium]
MSTTPIADYALLSDRHGAALVSRDGSVDWLCVPRVDSASIFGRLLGEQAGFWSLHAPDATVTRRYVDQTMVLETTYRTPTGTAVVVDALATGAGNRGHALGVDSPHLLLRQVTCTDGEVEVHLVYAPRPEYGLVLPLLDVVDGGLVATGGADVLVLSCPVPLDVASSSASGRVVVRAGEQAGFALHHARRADAARARTWSQHEIATRLDDTVHAWQSWSDLHQSYDGPWRDLVHHSGRVLQALSFQPTGAICAAATTSLPEVVGGSRNWDYRYAWVRDASFTIEALWVAACPDEADQFVEYMTAAAANSLDQEGDLQIMFGIGGERDLTERELPHLGGWRGSMPVRVGNGAWRQRQLDVYGELLSAVHRLSDRIFDPVARRVGPLSDPDQWEAAPTLAPSTTRFLVALADTAARRWQEPDQGIWEVRGEPCHFVYSKLMCWVALERATALAERLGAAERVAAWSSSQEQIREAILSEGWSDDANAFTQSFGSDDLDASNLMLSLVGFLPPDDPRVLSTIVATEERLTDARGLVYRYRAHDGLDGDEGVFLLCTFWLAQALAMAGEVGRARVVFERAAAFVNDVGLLSEEVDPTSGELLGNFPQAFSHIGLVNAAWAISQAEAGPAS